MDTSIIPVEMDEGLRVLSERPTPYPIPRQVGRKRVEAALIQAFELIGGVPRLVLWADQNPTEFYKIYARLLPSSPPGGASSSGGVLQVNISWASPERLSYQTVETVDES